MSLPGSVDMCIYQIYQLLSEESEVLKTRKLERKSEQQIPRFNDSSSSFSNHPPYFSGDYISQWLARIILIKRDVMLIYRDI